MGFLVFGPLMYTFSEWILKTSITNRAEQIIFFARDCKLPYLMCKEICKKLKIRIKLIYLQISRKSTTGIDLYNPEDIFKVRIDDFSKNSPVSNLLSERFLITNNEIEINNYKKNQDIDINKIVGTYTEEQLYSFIYSIAKKNWNILSLKYNKRRNVFLNYLKEELQCDIRKKTAAVDIGYKGTIHKKINNLFETDLISLFFMTYANVYGTEPIENAQVFYAKDQNPYIKINPIISHNLLFETLINEAIGSSLEIIEKNNNFYVVKDQNLHRKHITAISALHNGAVKFCSMWIDKCIKINNYFTFSKESCLYLFYKLVKEPNRIEINLLDGIEFDNNYSGIKTKYIISSLNKEHINSNIWPESLKLIRTTQHDNVNKNQKNNHIICIKRKNIYRIFVFISKYFLSKQKYQKLTKRPNDFFDDSKYKLVKYWGKKLLS